MLWKLKKKARNHLVQEEGTIFKEGVIRTALLYPNTYSIGSSNLGFQLIYKIINSIPMVSAERGFLPETVDIHLFDQGIDLFTLETQRNVNEFDIVAFSVPFEGDYINVLRMLKLAKIPLRSAERKEHHPIVIAGGMAGLLNPEPLAPFIDVFAIGEGEHLTGEIYEVIVDGQNENHTKAQIIEALSEVEGIYVPSMFEPAYNSDGTLSGYSPELYVKKRFVSDLDSYGTGSAIITKNTTFSDMHLIEVSRGCGGACRFCAEGFVYRYPRHRSKESILKEIRLAKANGHRVGLISPMLLDHPDIKDIIAEASKMGIETSLSSLRADALDEAMLAAIKLSGQKTLTIAPEAGSDSLRKSVNKHFTNEDIIKCAALASEYGIKVLKLYFLIGLPNETDDDVRAIGQLAKDIKAVFTKGRVTVGANPLVPKPWTPFQWASFPEIKDVERKYKLIRKEVSKTNGIELSLSSPRLFYIQAVLSRGSRRVADLLELTLEEEGSYAKAMKRWEGDPDFYAYRQPEPDELFPWDFIDHGMSKKFLRKEFEKSFQERRTPECITPICKLCGVC